MATFSFLLLPSTYIAHRFDGRASLPPRLLNQEGVFIVTGTGDCSVFAPLEVPIDAAESDAGWRCLKLEQAMGFDEVGIAAAITRVVAQAGVSVLVMSGYRHDYFFVRQENLDAVVAAFQKHGYAVRA